MEKEMKAMVKIVNPTWKVMETLVTELSKSIDREIMKKLYDPKCVMI